MALASELIKSMDGVSALFTLVTPESNNKDNQRTTQVLPKVKFTFSCGANFFAYPSGQLQPLEFLSPCCSSTLQYKIDNDESTRGFSYCLMCGEKIGRVPPLVLFSKGDLDAVVDGHSLLTPIESYLMLYVPPLEAYVLAPELLEFFLTLFRDPHWVAGRLDTLFEEHGLELGIASEDD